MELSRSEDNLLREQQRDHEKDVAEYNKFLANQRTPIADKIGSLYENFSEQSMSTKTKSPPKCLNLPPEQIRNLRKARKQQKEEETTFHNIIESDRQSTRSRKNKKYFVIKKATRSPSDSPYSKALSREPRNCYINAPPSRLKGEIGSSTYGTILKNKY